MSGMRFLVVLPHAGLYAIASSLRSCCPRFGIDLSLPPSFPAFFNRNTGKFCSLFD